MVGVGLMFGIIGLLPLGEVLVPVVAEAEGAVVLCELLCASVCCVWVVAAAGGLDKCVRVEAGAGALPVVALIIGAGGFRFGATPAGGTCLCCLKRD